MKDLIVSVADSYQEKVLESILPRLPQVYKTKTFSYDIIRNPICDSGSYNSSQELLRPFINAFDHAVVIFDYEGSGAEERKSREEVELDVEILLNRNGWLERNIVVVVSPEIETWMWVDSPHVHDAIGWERATSLYDWARQKGFLDDGAFKPERPKESLFEALRLCKTSKSSSIYKNIAAKVSFRRCSDPAFLKLIDSLRAWFSIEE